MAKFTKTQTAWALVASVGITVVSPVSAIDLLAPGLGANFTHIDKQHNTTSWAANNLLDDNPSTRWLSNRRDNDLILTFDAAMNERCFGGFSLENSGDSYSVRQFMLLYTDDTSLATDIGTAGWTPVPFDSNPSGPVNHLHWGQGGRLTAFSRQHSSTTWAAAHINNGNLADSWLSNRENNSLDFAFDTDWDGNTGDAINISQLQLHNYGSTWSVEKFQVEVSKDGAIYEKLEVPGTGPGDPDFNYALSHEGGNLDYFSRQHSSTTWAAANIHDGASSSSWLSNRTNNNLDFSFDPEADGTTGLSGDSGDYFNLEKFALDNYGGTWSVKQFQVLVKTAANNSWTAIPVPGSIAGQPDFNFALSHEGGILYDFSRQHSSTTWAAANIHDGSQQTSWLSNQLNNTLDFNFDPDGNSTPGEATDQFTLDSFAVENYGTDWSLKEFQVEVKTAANPVWTKLEVPGTAAGDADFNFLSKHEGAALTFIDRQHSTTTWAAANIFDGSHKSSWLSNRTTNTLEFDFDTDLNGAPGDAINFSKIQLLNYGTDWSVADFEMDVKIGAGGWQPVPAPGGGNTFTAAQLSTMQEWNVAAQNNVTAFRIRTLTNHGGGYTGIKELKLLGTSTGASHTFTAQQASTEQVFTLDAADKPVNVTDVRLRTISNHGGAYVGVREFKLLGVSITRNRTFVAQQASGIQEFSIDPADQPVDVTAIRLQTISNYDGGYVGIREIRFLGEAVTASHTFTALQAAGEQNFILDAEDKVADIVAARLVTIGNYGGGYVGIKQFGLLGDPIAPLYIFDAANAAAAQSWNFPAVSGKLFRFHTFDNYGSGYIGAREIGVMQAVGCYPAPVGAWNMDEPSWGTVTDSSGNNLNGTAYRGANTDDADPHAIPGSPGTCGYGVFDSGDQQYLSIPHNDILNGDSELTYSIWIYPHTWSGGIRQVMAKSVHGGGSGRAQMGIFSESGVLKGRAETGNGREDIQTALPPVDTWSHVALVFDGNTLKLYVNGAVASDGSFTTTTLVKNNDPLEIGRRTLSDRYFFDGFMDEAKVFDAALTAAEIGYVMNQTRPCTPHSDPEQPAAAFNCVEPGGDALTGRLYTKVVGNNFNFDVYALKDADSDGSPDSVESEYVAASNTKDVTIELVDTSGASCDASTAVIDSQTLTFVNGDQGFVSASDARMPVYNFNVAYPSVSCRVSDGSGVPGCSDSFTIRPTGFVVDSATRNGDSSLLNQSGSTGNSTRAGYAASLDADDLFTLLMTTARGYVPGAGALPSINTALLTHSGANAGNLSGTFDTRNDETNHVSVSGSSFAYSEVGNFMFGINAIYDDRFADLSGDLTNGDCISAGNDSFSNNKIGDLYGCYFGNTNTYWVGRFKPHHFTVTLDVAANDVGLENSCQSGGFSYAGTEILFADKDLDTNPDYPKFTVTARNSGGDQTFNYNDTVADYAKLVENDVLTAISVTDATAPVAFTTNSINTWTDNDNGSFTFEITDGNFSYDHLPGSLFAPFDSGLNMTLDSFTDSDGISSIATPLTLLDASSDAINVRYGRLTLINAYGSELETLPMPMLVEYYNGAGSDFVPNTADDCTLISDVVITRPPGVSQTLDVSDTCIWDSAGNSGAYNCASAGSGADQYFVTPVAADYNLNLKAPGTGNTGVLNITADAPSHLKYNWSGTVDNPTATATFGIHNTDSNLIFMREVR